MNPRMKALMIVALCAIAVASGCGGLGTVTPEQPLGAAYDPNQAQAYVDAFNAASHAVTAAGTASGNPAIATIGLIGTALAGIGTAAVVATRKKS